MQTEHENRLRSVDEQFVVVCWFVILFLLRMHIHGLINIAVVMVLLLCAVTKAILFIYDVCCYSMFTL